MMEGRNKEDRRRRGKTWKGTGGGKEEAAEWQHLSTTQERIAGFDGDSM